MTLTWDGIREFACYLSYRELWRPTPSLLSLFFSFRIVASWIKERNQPEEASELTALFDRYIPPLLEGTKSFPTIIPIREITKIQMTCHLFDCLLAQRSLHGHTTWDSYEIYFVFAAIWGFGSSLCRSHHTDWRLEFSKFWIAEFPSIKFAENASVFDYFVDPKTKKLRMWREIVPDYVFDADVPLQSVLIPTEWAVCLHWFLEILIEKKLPIMIVGGAGTGKTVTINEKVSHLPDNYAVSNILFNFYTTSESLQKSLEKTLEKKVGRNYGPTGSKCLLYFVDDLNIPEVDAFGTVSAHQTVRQFMDYRHWYDRTKWTLKEIRNCQFIASMNPSAGSFLVDPRLQRHFYTFAFDSPDSQSLFYIFNTIFGHHLDTEHNGFTLQHKNISKKLITMAIALHNRVAQLFVPTAVKFHYLFNLRDLVNIFQGLLFATRETCPGVNDLVRLYIHEANRTYGDKLIDEIDSNAYRKLFRDLFKKHIEDMDDAKLFREPLVFCHFADGLNEAKYMEIGDWPALTALLTEAVSTYNDLVGQMDLVLFEDAMSHICRINRILEGPRSNALLIGVGGSGKQSLAKLSAFISSLSLYQIQLHKGYNIADLRADLNTLYQKTALKNIPTMFLITDAHVADESFLVVINDMLASREVTDLFSDEETDAIVESLRNEVKQLGTIDTREACWKYFMDKVKRMLKVFKLRPFETVIKPNCVPQIVLSFSPVDGTLRRRTRKFPALVNCTSIDYFHEWPKSALESVSKKFLSSANILQVIAFLQTRCLPYSNCRFISQEDLIEPVSVFMAYALESVNAVSQTYLLNEKRYNYTTPKSFLELIAIYSKLLTEKMHEMSQKIYRLDNGLICLVQCSEQVDTLKVRTWNIPLKFCHSHLLTLFRTSSRSKRSL